MRFADIKSNGPVCRALAGMVDSGRIPHAIMFCEDDAGGAIAIAQAFLQYLFCLDHRDQDSCGNCPTCNKISKLIHPDIKYIFPVSGAPSLSFMKEFRSLVLSNPFFSEQDLYSELGIEGKSTIINVAEAKEVLETLSLSSLEGGYKAVVIYLPEKMNQEAANRLLKAIEEPPAKTQFVLISHSPEQVLSTIRSRCQNIRILPSGPKTTVIPEESQIQYDDCFASLMDALTSKNLFDALEVGEQLAALPSRESAKAFCSYAADRIRIIFLLQQGVRDLISEEYAREDVWSKRCKKTFPRSALIVLSRTRNMIERNVNIKILFADMVNRLSLSI